MMKLVVSVLVLALVAVSLVTYGVVAAIAELAAFVVVVTWVLKSKQAVKRKEAHIEPHV